jgi:hypothetical protein
MTKTEDVYIFTSLVVDTLMATAVMYNNDDNIRTETISFEKKLEGCPEIINHFSKCYITRVINNKGFYLNNNHMRLERDMDTPKLFYYNVEWHIIKDK